MSKDELRKFDKETLVIFIAELHKNDKGLLSLLNILERSVTIDKLLKKSQQNREQARKIADDISKTQEYCNLLKKGMRISKKLDKLFEENNAS